MAGISAPKNPDIADAESLILTTSSLSGGLFSALSFIFIFQFPRNAVYGRIDPFIGVRIGDASLHGHVNFHVEMSNSI